MAGTAVAYGPGNASADQRRDRRPPVDPVRPPLRVLELALGTDAQKVEDRRRQVGRRVRLARRYAALPVRLADHLARADAAAGKEAREDVAPVVAAGREDFAGGVLAPNADGR